MRLRPRVRLDGSYILTARYIKSGERNPWATTALDTKGFIEVVYWRILRFREHGQCEYLMSVRPPENVTSWFSGKNKMSMQIEKGTYTLKGYVLR